MTLTRYWIEFDIQQDAFYPSWLSKGCGVTAYSYLDAVQILRDQVFKDKPVPAIRTIIENVDISTLDTSHVLPNMGMPVRRGVWYPKLE